MIFDVWRVTCDVWCVISDDDDDDDDDHDDCDGDGDDDDKSFADISNELKQ